MVPEVRERWRRDVARLSMVGGGARHRAAAAVIIALWMLAVVTVLYASARLVLR